jgi:hypothetical protein
MSNFDFLKGFNNELYEIGVKLEEDVIDSPRAVTADATFFALCKVMSRFMASSSPRLADRSAYLTRGVSPLSAQ